MRRDVDLIRKILFAIEEDDWIYTGVKISGYEESQVYYHLVIMSDANLISIRVYNPDYPPEEDIKAVRLTWEGHEFLEAIRDDKRWEKVKTEMSKGRGFVFDVAKSIAIDFLEEEINPYRVQSLKSQLVRRYINLNKLEVQAAGHGANAIPLELSNAIDAEKEAITELEDRLRLLTG